MTRTDPSPVPPDEGTEDELDRLRALIRNLPGIVYVEDADPEIEGPGPFLYVSPAVERILGYTVEEWLADPAGWVDRLHPDDVPSMRAAFQAVVPTGAPYSADYRMFAKDGRIVWIHDDAVLVRDEEGTPALLAGRDVRDDRAPGHARTARRGRAALPGAHRADAGRHLHRREPARPHERVLQPAGRDAARVHARAS